jgi:integrase
MARRDKGTGHVAAKPNAKGLYPGYATINGKRQYVYGRTRTDCRLKVQALYKEASAPRKAEPLRVSGMLDRWLDAMRAGRTSKRKLAPATLLRYEQLVVHHLKPRIGDLKLSDLTAEDLDRMYDELAVEATRSAPHLAHRTIRAALGWAWKRDLVPVNVALKTNVPALDPNEKRSLSEEEAGALLKAADGTDEGAMLWLTIGGGLRFGEVAALVWDDLDLYVGVLTVRRSARRVGRQGLLVSDPKSRAGIRRLKLSDVVVRVLVEHKRRQLASGVPNPHDLVFPNKAGGWRESQNFRAYKWIPLLKATKVGDERLFDRYDPVFCYHELRHTNASFLGAAGVDIKTVQARLGHSDPSMTMHYTHSLDSADQDAAERMDAFLKNLTSSRDME